MTQITRRTLLIAGTAAAGVRVLPQLVVRQKRVLTLVYDKSIGAMRAIDRLVP